MNARREARCRILELLTPGTALSPVEVRSALGLPERTVRWALRRLETDGLVGWRSDPRDARFRKYFVLDRPSIPVPASSCQTGPVPPPALP